MTREQRIAALKAAADERILIIDGAMGTMIQRYKLDEADLPRRALCRPRQARAGQQRSARADQAARRSRRSTTAYLAAGADIICTNTFNAQRISLADYGMEELAYEMNVAAAKLARDAADARDAPRRRTGRASSPARWARPTAPPRSRPDVNNPGFRNVSLRRAGRGLCRAGARPDRGRRRSAADRDGVRHAQCQGGWLRGAARCSTSWAWSCR